MDPLFIPLLIVGGLALILLGVHGLPSLPASNPPTAEVSSERLEIHETPPPAPLLPVNEGDLRRHDALIEHLMGRMLEVQTQLDELRAKVEGDEAAKAQPQSPRSKRRTS
jgi:hypothetical protein